MDSKILIKTDIKVSQALPFIEKVAKHDGLRINVQKDFNLAWGKLKLIFMICEQNGLCYWINREFRIAITIYNQSLLQN